MAASTQVLGIPELLEMTLLHVTELPLLTLQRVNKTWRDVIEGSSRLQQKLCTKADPIDVSGEPEDFNTKSFDWNPLFLNYAKKNVTYKDSCPGKEIDRKILERFYCPGASWRKMFITQPTGLKVGLSYIRELRKAGDPGVKVGWMAIGMQERAGIEMDDVATLTEEAHERYGELVAGVQVQVIISGAFTR